MDKKSDQVRSLRCMDVWLQEMKSEAVDVFVPKIMATLKSAIADEALAITACEVWSTFIMMLSDATLKVFV